MDSSFDRYFNDFLIPHEGSIYECDPVDRGGCTKYGIDQASHPDVNIRTLTKAGAKAIYLKDYWSPIRGSELPWPLDVVVMDIAVNNGRTRAIQWLQTVTNATVDGVFGPKTLKAAKAADPVYCAKWLLRRRERFYNAIATGSQKKFLRGWLNRNNDLAAYIK